MKQVETILNDIAQENRKKRKIEEENKKNINL